MDVLSWGGFRSSAPDLSARAAERVVGGLWYLATIRADGHPRVHPVGLNVHGDRLIVPMSPSSPKAHDLRRCSRFAVHCAVEDNEGGQGEVLLTGLASECDAGDVFAERGWITFELRVGEALVVTNHGSGPAASRWRAPEA